MSLPQNALQLAAERYKSLALQECFDPVNLESRPTAQQLQVLSDIGKIDHRYVTAGNQGGQSQLGSRECAWIFTETHPTWKRPAHWGDEPLLLVVVGRTAKQVEEVLWRKISAFLEPDSYHVTRVGNALQKVVHKKNKNTILFASHHSEREAREKLQAYVAHWVWLDELPSSVRLIEELHRRVQAKKGPFLSTFTPKTPNTEIKKLIDNSKPPLARKYQFSMFDNPIYSEEDKKKILQSLATYPEAYRRTILYGEWAQVDSAVYSFDRETMVEEPPGYGPNWRHVLSVDPALQSKFGYSLWAESPNTGVWYLVQADYIQGIYSPEEVFNETERRASGHRLVRRVCDPHEAWYIGHAAAQGITHVTPWNKAGRKGELIKGLQAALSEGKVKIAPWCTKFMEEIETCSWSEEAADRIVNARSYHLLDCAQYFVDCRPPVDVKYQAKPWHQELREGHAARKKAEAMKQRRAQVTRGPRIGRKRWLFSS